MLGRDVKASEALVVLHSILLGCNKMTVLQPYQKRVGITLRRQTTMVDAVRKRKGPAPERHDFQARKVAKALRETVPVRQQAQWAREDALEKMRNAI
jgi:hypothetical protein